jgi:hypothetical protein
MKRAKNYCSATSKKNKEINEEKEDFFLQREEVCQV